MKKKLLITVLALVCTLCCALGLAACGGGGDGDPLPNGDNITLQFYSNSVSLPVGEGMDLEVSYNGGEHLTWVSSNKDVVEIVGYSANICNIYGVDVGEAKITVSAGDKSATCNVTVISDTGDHVLTFVPEKEATCTERGNLAYYKCSHCTLLFRDAAAKEEIFEDEIIIGRAPHDYVNGYCKNCGTIEATEGLAYASATQDPLTGIEVEMHAIIYGVGSATDPDIVISPEHYEYPVTVISRNAFQNCDWITSVYIPETVEYIESGAFRNCTALKEIKCATNLVYIAADAFENTAIVKDFNSGSYDALYIGNALISVKGSPNTFTVKDGTTAIGGRVFYENENLTSVTLPDSIKGIGDNAFAYCHNLIQINLPEGLTRVGSYAFAGCANATLTLPSGIEYIGNYAFQSSGLEGKIDLSNVLYISEGAFSYTGISEVILSKNMNFIANNMFGSCESLTSISIPEWVTYIGYSAFEYSGLTEITLPAGLIALDSYALAGTDITECVIPESVEELGSRIFQRCSSLQSVTLPSHITEIGAGMFAGCTSLQSVTIPAGVTKIGETAFTESGLTSIILPEGITEIGARAFGWTSIEEIIIPAGATNLGERLFEYCFSLVSVILPDGLSAIPDSMFYGCSELASISIPSAVTSIGSFAFVSCKRLTEIILPEGITEIGAEAFGYTAIEEIIIPASVTTVGEEIFYECTNLVTATVPAAAANYLPSSVTNLTINVGTLTANALSALSNLTELVIESGVTAINGNALAGLGKLERLTVPFVGAGNSYVFGSFFGTTAFNGATATAQITSITSSGVAYTTNYYIPDALTSVTVLDGPIAQGAFSNCANLTEIILNSDTFSPLNTAIGVVAFYGCSSLESIVIPDCVTLIGSQAFWGCSKLTSIDLNKVESISANTFEDCTSLSSVTIPATTYAIGSEVFKGCTSLTSVMFENTSGWYTYNPNDLIPSFTAVDISNATNNAINFINSWSSVAFTWLPSAN